MDSSQKCTNLPNPREKANLFSVIFMGYSFGLFKKRLFKVLTLEDLWVPLDCHRSKVLGASFEITWKQEQVRQKHTGKKPSLLRALLRAFHKQIIYSGLALIVSETSLRMCQPFLMGRMLRYFDHSDVSSQEALLYAAAVVLLTLLFVFIQSNYGLLVHILALEVRVALSTVVYSKIFRLSSSTARNPGGGNVINLLSIDIKLLPYVLYVAHFIWMSPMFISVITYVVWSFVGWPGVIAITTAVSLIIVILLAGRLGYTYRKITEGKTDQRIKMTEEIILGVRSIKMYAWEKPFFSLLNDVRRTETKFIKKNSMLRGLFAAYLVCGYRITLFSVMISMAYFGNKFTAETVFTVASYLTSAVYFSAHFYRVIQEGTEALVMVKRIEKYLLQDEIPLAPHVMNTSAKDTTGRAVIIKNVTSSWNHSHTEPTLSNINVNVKNGSVVVIIGPVGCGKSSLLEAILGELPPLNGSVNINGNVSYASQEPWIFPDTVRQNITFSRPYQKELYNNVVRVCALEADFLQFPNGDMSRVGEKGCSLSGGQKARINLARAVYHGGDIFLLDDPLSAVDTHVANHLFEECILSYLEGKTRLLVTHQLQYIKKADHIVVIKKGRVEIQGSFADITKSKFDIAKYLKSEESSSANQESTGISFGSKTDRKHIPEVTGQALQAYETSMSKGKLTRSAYREYFWSGSNFVITSIIALTFALTQVSANVADYWMAYWTRTEEMKFSDRYYYDVPSSPRVNYSMQDAVNRSSERITLNEEWTSSTGFFIIIYVVIISLLIILSAIQVLTFYNACEASSNRIHNEVLNRIMRTRTTFFDINPSGRLLERLSGDIRVIDEAISKSLTDSVKNILQSMAPFIMVSILNYWLLFVAAVVVVVYCVIVYIYVKTSTNLMRLEAASRNPVCVHVNSTVQGLSTIRALKAQKALKREFDQHQDLYTSATYAFSVALKALSLYVEFLGFAFITCVVFSCFTTEKDLNGANVGVVLIQSMLLLNFLQYGTAQLAAVAENMTAVERILEYKYLEEEKNLDPTPENAAPLHWPDRGCIQFQNVSLNYMDKGPLVLKNVNILINPGEKVGIVGRTGAGKSSLILALFRLVRVEGCILIDGVDTSAISLHELRKNISIIPQDPFLFSGTLRENLDRFGEFQDYELLRALEDVELNEILKGSNRLSMAVADKGNNFSVGQKQLLCLARAILRNNKILVLDEATANVDLRTDELIQKTIRAKFARCTVLTVAHRLNTIMDSDKVMVMDKGELVEFDHPHILLQNSEGAFFKLVQRTGQLHSLATVASQSYERLKAPRHVQ